ncbi:MAG: Holliday junction resolvase RuvX [Candidatus Brocadiia bacterium]
MEITIGVDYGDRRIGLAVSDPMGMIATPHSMLEHLSDEEAGKRIAKLAHELGATEVVVGLPRNMDGSEGFRAEKTRKFVEILEEIAQGLKVLFFDERLTTVQAQRSLRLMDSSRKEKKEKVDTMAATLLLQAYLDHKSFQKIRENPEPD